MTTRARQVLDDAMSEAELQAAVIRLAHDLGWLVSHTRPAMRADGQWRTPIQGDAGYVDVTLAHPKHGVLFVELKTQRGVRSPAQMAWAEVLGPTGRYRLWRPQDIDAIVRELKGGVDAT